MIDARATVNQNAKLAEDVIVGPYTVIGADVEIDSGTEIGSNVVITGPTKIGKNNKILQFASVGAPPQHIEYKGEPTTLEIGDNNLIREFCSLHRGTVSGRGKTVIGSNNMLMAYVHVAHDCILGSKIIIANAVNLAGHVVVGDAAVFGGLAVVSQGCTVGAYAFIVGTTPVNKDILPYTLISGHNRKGKAVYGLNVIGLRRNNFSNDTIRKLKQAYHVIYQEDLLVAEAISKLETMLKDCPEIQLLIDGIKQSTRGIVR